MNEYLTRSNADTTHPFLIYRYKLWSINSGVILGFDCIISKQRVVVSLMEVGHSARGEHSQRMHTGGFCPQSEDV
jgi:hypothetical protein